MNLLLKLLLLRRENVNAKFTLPGKEETCFVIPLLSTQKELYVNALKKKNVCYCANNEVVVLQYCCHIKESNSASLFVSWN